MSSFYLCGCSGDGSLCTKFVWKFSWGSSHHFFTTPAFEVSWPCQRPNILALQCEFSGAILAAMTPLPNLRFDKAMDWEFDLESEFLIAAIFSLLKISWKYLQYCMFPVGRLLKSRVKEIAASIGLGRIAKRKEVPDCCCVGPVSPLLFAKTT